MNQAHMAVNLINWGANVAFLVPFLFPFYIRLIWAWHKDEWGWNIVTLDMAVSIALLPSFVHRVIGVNVNTALFAWIVAGSIWAIPIIVIWRSVMIWRKQRHANLVQPAEEEEEER